MTYLVQASPQYEVEHYLWSYPLVGSLPYKGFFEKEDAVKESNTLKQKGYDTMVRGVKAYSTLGWLKDPILSSMLTYKDSELVNLIIHESTHATLYIKSSADFNEQLASFVGNEGTEQFYRFKEGPLSETLKKILNTNHDEKMFSKFISEEIQKLKKWYADNPTKHNSNDKIARLQEINKNFVKIKREFVTTDFDFFEKSELNNAVLIGYKTYSEDMDNFEIAYKNVNKDMRRFLEVCKNLKNSKNPKEDLLNSK